ncbi:MAG TPA: cytochrome B subunit [Bdellovibrionales bacterium]|nr:MAG: hypothetical protein A2X97_14890 [Bdellovibrionales bacterium GWA1_52_35]OFZ41223.1 MAG: hypothetical protein A2070_03845 [Bdellovibrionales bacterium GWC1_52_8]HAR43121.1 cytochrome B subunit [Bdellovibrionales bacterium]HCM39828.1 cytochrome B subunit [Bdellovibrionales bacterium]
MASTGFFSSSIGKKYLIGLTAIFISLFVFTHMLGNMLLFVSPEVYNGYSHKLLTNPLIVLIELFFLALFLTHVLYTIKTTLENKEARGQRFTITTSGAKAVTFSSKTMIYHGALIFVFLVLHLLTFKYGQIYEATYNGVVMRDLHRLVIEVFQIPSYVVWYVIAVFLLGLHLHHGVQSIFQTLGFNQPRYTPAIRKIGLTYAWVVAIGYMFQPLYVFFFYQQ